MANGHITPNVLVVDDEQNIRDAVALMSLGVHRLDIDLQIGEHGADVADEAAAVEGTNVHFYRERTICGRAPFHRDDSFRTRAFQAFQAGTIQAVNTHATPEGDIARNGLGWDRSATPRKMR